MNSAAEFIEDDNKLHLQIQIDTKGNKMLPSVKEKIMVTA